MCFKDVNDSGEGDGSIGEVDGCAWEIKEGEIVERRCCGVASAEDVLAGIWAGCAVGVNDVELSVDAEGVESAGVVIKRIPGVIGGPNAESPCARFSV